MFGHYALQSPKLPRTETEIPCQTHGLKPEFRGRRPVVHVNMGWFIRFMTVKVKPVTFPS